MLTAIVSGPNPPNSFAESSARINSHAKDLNAPFRPRDGFVFLPITSGSPESDGLLDRWLYDITLLTDRWTDTVSPIEARRGFRDFEVLRRRLGEENPGAILPPLPALDWVGLPTKVLTNVRPDPVVVMWRMRGLSMFLEHLADCAPLRDSPALRHFMCDDAGDWFALFTELKKTQRDPSRISKLFRSPRVLRRTATPSSCPTMRQAEEWATGAAPALAALRDRLGKLREACLGAPEDTEATVRPTSHEDPALAAIEGISDLIRLAESTRRPQVDQWLVLLMADVSFYGGLTRSVLDACQSLRNHEREIGQRMAAKDFDGAEADLLCHGLERAQECFTTDFRRWRTHKRPLVTRMCHTFAKLAAHLLDSPVDWRPTGHADPWLSLLPDFEDT
jgi:hypothetical protein